MYRIIFLSIIFVILLTIVSPASAVTNSVSDRMMKTGSKAAEVKDGSLDKLKERATNEIDRRIESLNKLLTRLGEFKKLSTAQKSSLTTQVQAEVIKLTALKTKVAGDTDLTTLKTDMQSIVNEYRIYALFIPKIQILGSADRLLTTSDEMSTHATTLEAKITEKQTAGQDVTDLQTLLTDMKAKIADAKTQAQSAIDTVTPLTPEGFPDNKTQLQSAKQMIVTGIKDLNAARQDARKIIVGLMKLGKMTSEESGKPTKAPEATQTP